MGRPWWFRPIDHQPQVAEGPGMVGVAGIWIRQPVIPWPGAHREAVAVLTSLKMPDMESEVAGGIGATLRQRAARQQAVA